MASFLGVNCKTKPRKNDHVSETQISPQRHQAAKKKSSWLGFQVFPAPHFNRLSSLNQNGG